MRRKIYTRIDVDTQTGEVMKTSSEYVENNISRFFMGRTTEGIEWLLRFNNITEMQLLIIMLELEVPNNRNIVQFTKLQVEESSAILGVSEPMIKKCLGNLVKNDFVVRITQGNFLVNPYTFYKGGTSELRRRYEEYCKYRVK